MAHPARRARVDGVDGTTLPAGHGAALRLRLARGLVRDSVDGPTTTFMKRIPPAASYVTPASTIFCQDPWTSSTVFVRSARGVEWDGKHMYELSSNATWCGGSAAVHLDAVEPPLQDGVALTALRGSAGGERRARAKLHDQASQLLQMWHDTGRAALQLHGV